MRTSFSFYSDEGWIGKGVYPKQYLEAHDYRGFINHLVYDLTGLKRLYQQLAFNDTRLIGSEKIALAAYYDRFPLAITLFRIRISKRDFPHSFSYRKGHEHFAFQMQNNRWEGSGLLLPDSEIDQESICNLFMKKMIPQIEFLLKEFGRYGEDQIITDEEIIELQQACDATLMLLLKIRKRIESAVR